VRLAVAGTRTGDRRYARGVEDEAGSSWGDRDVVACFLETTGFSDAGEEVALSHVFEQRRGHVLDIGVGGGRTTGLLQPDALFYIGLDVAEPMVDLARRRFPEAQFELGDARDLAGLPDKHFDLVVFSFNGLDALDRGDRLQALQAMRRVVAPEGRVLFSSLSIDGASFDESPWHFAGLGTSRGMREAALAVRHPGNWLRGLRNYRQLRHLSEDGDGWAMRPLRVHEFRFLVHFATMADTVGMARQVGLEVLAAVTDDGTELDPTSPRADADYVHFVCRPSPT
jgi:ubiquinone/menaquinone biosynthesis C-methylase UbiE